MEKYFSLLNQLIFTEVISEIWLIRSHLFLAIWISQISLIISEIFTELKSVTHFWLLNQWFSTDFQWKITDCPVTYFWLGIQWYNCKILLKNSDFHKNSYMGVFGAVNDEYEYIDSEKTFKWCKWKWWSFFIIFGSGIWSAIWILKIW